MLPLPDDASFHDGSSFLCQAATDLAGSLTTGQSVFLLADQSGLPGIASLWPCARTMRWASVLASEHGQPDGGSPLLLDLTGADPPHVRRRLLDAFYEQGRFANCLSLLCSELPLKELAVALNQRSRAELPDRLSVLLRYFDTRTLPLLPRLLSAKQYAEFMSCACSWKFVDRWGHIRVLEASQAGSSTASFTAPLILDVEQERMLVDDGMADAVIDQFVEQRYPPFLGRTPPEQFDMVCGPVEAAAAQGISDVRDVMLFCCAAWSNGDGFEQRSPWAERLARHRVGAISLEDALAK